MSTSRRALAETYEAQDLIIQAAQDMKREATKAYREHLDSRGMDKDAVKAEVEGFKKAFRRKMDSKKKGPEAVEHVDAIADEIYLEITAPRAPRATRVEIIEEFDAETGEITPSPLTKAAGQAQSDAVVDSANKQSGSTSLPGAEGAEDREPIQSEPDDAAVTAGDVLREPAAAEQGQNIREGDAPRETDRSGGDASRPDTELPETADDDRSCVSVPGGLANGLQQQATRKGEAARPLPPTYPAPGLVVMEHTPPEGAIAHPYATCWPVRDIDPAGGIREPIVKIGKLILDGRGRMFAARGVDGGKGIEYPVVQYDGADPLMDSIQWNLASRPNLHPHNLKMIATKLAKLEPARADEVMAAFGLDEERQAAE